VRVRVRVLGVEGVECKNACVCFLFAVLEIGGWDATTLVVDIVIVVSCHCHVGIG
jgi:hypothetical protein